MRGCGSAKHPSLGSQAISSRLDLPRSRIRGWIRKPDDEQRPARPDAIRGIQIAERRGWLPAHYGANTFSALSRAVAWIFSGGSIDTTWYVPLFTIGGTSDPRDLELLLDELGVGCRVSREVEEGRAAEYRPAQNASVLGRVLSLLGAPVGRKTPDAPINLPSYLTDAPDSVRREFIEVYLQNRGQRYEDKETVHFREDRSIEYLHELSDFIGDVSGERVTVSDRNIIVSADAMRSLRC